MLRPVLLLATAPLLASCASPAPADPVAASRAAATTAAVTRTVLDGDVVEYDVSLPLASGPDGVLHVARVVRERAPWLPRAGRDAAMLVHGDFSSFASNFVPAGGGGLAIYLAQHGVDVWGVDRRWNDAPVDGDLSDFPAMGLQQEVGDIGTAVAFARAARLLGGATERLDLIGFSRGGQLAYLSASVDATRPAALRGVKGVVSLDMPGVIAPTDTDELAFACENADGEQQALDAGIYDADDSFFTALGQLAISAPDDPSPIFDGYTNRAAFLVMVGQTYQLAPFTPLYHLNAPVLDAGGAAIGLSESPEDVVATWLADAAPHQAMRELAESDALFCGTATPAIDAPLDRIRVPALYLGAAGGWGDRGAYTLGVLGSKDTTSLVIRRFGPDREAEDFGHADLLFASDAPTLAWDPLLAWMRAR